MCTAITYKTKDHYFGRNLDLEYSYKESVTIAPRNFQFRNISLQKSPYAMIGMAYIQDGYPLYYDAVNEAGLGMAGLSFEGNCIYNDETQGKDNIASFELIPWILQQCKSIHSVKSLIKNLNITNKGFSKALPPSPLHWIICDSCESIVLEQTKDGLYVYDNPVGVLTNNPTFDIQLHNLNNYMMLSPKQPQNQFGGDLGLMAYSRGMGALGLPGDLSSSSRFVRAAFTKANSLCDTSEISSISQFFHILNSVEQQRGCVDLGGKFEITVYSSCCNTDKGIYYYKTYDNSRITAIDMHKEDLNGTDLISYELLKEQDIKYQN